MACILIYFLLGIVFPKSGFNAMVSENYAKAPKAWFFLIFRIVLFAGFFVIVKFLFDNHEEKQEYKLKNEILMRENAEAKHEVLKQKVDPHFLFNSLSTLRSLISRDSDLAIQFTDELAYVYRHMLLYGDKNSVRLCAEIDFIEAYLALMRIRFGDAIRTYVHIGKGLEEYYILPHTLQLLVENAIKHNGFSMERPLQIEIFTKNDALIVRNNVVPKKSKGLRTGFGLKNIHARYGLQYKRKIAITQTKDFFEVRLTLIKQ